MGILSWIVLGLIAGAIAKFIMPGQPNKTGILPDIEVKRSYNAYLKGRDNVLEQAIEELGKQVKK